MPPTRSLHGRAPQVRVGVSPTAWTSPFARRASLLLWMLLSIIVTACGGGDAADATALAGAGREQAQALAVPPLNIPADAHLKGVWSAVFRWPLIPIHVVHLQDGRLLSFGYAPQQATSQRWFAYDVWDGQSLPDAGHLTQSVSTGSVLFCGSQLVLPQGNPDVLVLGGSTWTGTTKTDDPNSNSNLWSPATGRFTRGAEMLRPRWYSTATTLPNGETHIMGGSGGADLAEIRGLDGSFRALSFDTSFVNWYYPRNFVLGDGRIFGFSMAGAMYYIDPRGAGTLRRVGQFANAYTGWNTTAAMFRPGRILQMGATVSNGAIVIDANGDTPVITPTQSMSQQRQYLNSALLPDGTVLATGGAPLDNKVDNANNLAEIWHPETGTWTTGSAGAIPRLYHSISMLRQDGSVLVGGGGIPGPLINDNVEIYYPPYLFAEGGGWAPRPTIAAAPTTLDIGRKFNVQVGNAAGVARVTLVRTGSVTHGFNMEQRFLDLAFRVANGQLEVQAPTQGGDAPPGYYHLFVLDANGVPSVSRILRVAVAGQAGTGGAPTLQSPGDQTSTLDTAVQLALQGSDPNGDPLQWSATGLPPGLSIDGVSGVITGTPTDAGTYDVTLSVNDGAAGATEHIVWQVQGPVELRVTDPVSTGPAVVGSSVQVGVTATGQHLRYRWQFGDGSPATEWSSSATASHVYARAGNFYVSVDVTDDSGVVITRSFLQTLHFPLTAKAPVGSSPIAYERRAAGDRVWVVNPDNDSVSVLDARSRARLAEITVGQQPRTLAVAPDGIVWVVNRGSSSLSLIDPVTLAVTRTIWTPRAQTPFGIVFSPTTGDPYVTWEATGQLVRYSRQTFATTARVTVGADARHLAIGGDGGTVYVSRYITPPLPGESTAVVDTGGNVGGQLVRVSTATMKITGTTVLRHSDRADTENQGRGIPNYLGALAISPDGLQGVVPSKQDNIKRGPLRDGLALDFQTTVRAISSRVVLPAGTEDLAGRIDHDNASLATAAAYDPLGVYLFVALETSREVVVLDANTRAELTRVPTGLAPQGLAMSGDGRTLMVHHFMDRSVGFYDLRPLLDRGLMSLPLLGTTVTIAKETLPATVVRGKKLFYDARDPRLAQDRYMSCASCHQDGGHDGRVWDLSSLGEGLRNTIALRGRGAGHGRMHWSGNFDEVQDFEGQIRTLAGGTGLMSDAAFNTGTRSQPLGDRKTGLSADLDALAAYVASLNRFDVSPYRVDATTLTAAGSAGKQVFIAQRCGSCHSGTAFTNSATNVLVDVGTLRPTSGKRLGAALTGLDVPTLRDVWATAPYLHDGSAPTIQEAIKRHRDVALDDASLANLAAYLRELGRDEVTAP